MPCNLQKSGPDTESVGLVHQHFLGFSGSNPSTGNSTNPSRLCWETLITRGNGVPQTSSQVKVETNAGSGEAPSSSKKWYNLMEQIMYYTVVVCCISFVKLRHWIEVQV
jgi:hypothetical protein